MEEDKIFVCIWTLKGQVDNGGFDQYFFNSPGCYWKDTIHSLGIIGAKEMKRLLSKAVTVFPDSAPSFDDQERRQQVMDLGEQACAHLSRLDSQFYQADETAVENLDSLLYDYLKRQEA